MGVLNGWERGGYGRGFAKDVFSGLYSMDFMEDFMQWAEDQMVRIVGGLCSTPGSQPYATICDHMILARNYMIIALSTL